MPDAKSSVQATKASVENLNLLQAGRGELAFTLGDSLPTPGRATRKPASRRRSTSCAASPAIYPNYIQIVASADSGIKTLADLKGKRISVGAPKSGTELNARGDPRRRPASTMRISPRSSTCRSANRSS